MEAVGLVDKNDALHHFLRFKGGASAKHSK